MSSFTVKFVVELDIAGHDLVDVIRLINGGRAQLIIDERQTHYGLAKHMDTLEIIEEQSEYLDLGKDK